MQLSRLPGSRTLYGCVIMSSTKMGMAQTKVCDYLTSQYHLKILIIIPFFKYDFAFVYVIITKSI